jgi:membrane-associated protease RseP (regulator of RpoE activity)
MRRLLTLIFLAVVAVPAAAQETPRPARPPRPPRDSTVERSFGFTFGPEGMGYQVGRRGRLGVVVDLSSDPAHDSIGARITAVTPGGAADKAGVRTGDIVVQLNGTRLAGQGRARGDAEDESDGSAPGHRLIELASRLHTGDTVRLELRRDTRPLNVTLVAGESGMEGMVRAFTLPATARAMAVPFQGGRMSIMFDGAPLANLELVKMNPGLADYFGTSEGILVVNAPGDSSLGLRAGDVVLAIGGRKPTSPSHAFRILGTYEANESVSLEVVRMKRHITVTGKMPDRGAWRVSPNGFDLDQFLRPDLDDAPQLLRDLPKTEFFRMPGGLELPRMQMPERQLLREMPGASIRLPPMPVDRLKLVKLLIET